MASAPGTGTTCNKCGANYPNAFTMLCYRCDPIPPVTMCRQCGAFTNGLSVCSNCISKYQALQAPYSPKFAAQYGYATTAPMTPTPRPPLEKTESTEPIVGFRVWNLDRKTGTLRSVYTQFDWPFRKKIQRDDIKNNGIYAAKNITSVLSGSRPSVYDPAGLLSTGQPSLWEDYKADVAGSVYLWGEVTEHQLGYRAEFAYPKSLWMPEETDPLLIMQIEDNYGIPVQLRKEFKKHPSAEEIAAKEKKDQDIYKSMAAAMAASVNTPGLGAAQANNPRYNPFNYGMSKTFTLGI